MAITRRILLVSVLVMCLTFALPTTVQGCDAQCKYDDFSVVVDYANYLDLDGDSAEDDVLTIARVYRDTQYSSVLKTKIFSFVQVPSGRMFHSIVNVNGDYSNLVITIEWFNTAKEAGWYDLDIFVIVITTDGAQFLYTSLSFDPPEGGDPGPPLYPDVEINETVSLS
ncbi:MAG: exported protein of unknown function [Candidatus Thorarchaeota archaeon]|nr:MAG: exported protein of unknown function [Candidatus Thorarchaeota archaeon]